MSTDAPQGASGDDPDAHLAIVSMFHDPDENSDTMASIPRGRAQAAAVGMSHFDGRAKRNASIVRYWDQYLRLTRSEEKWGSEQMANVAAKRAAGPADALAGLLGNQAPAGASDQGSSGFLSGGGNNGNGSSPPQVSR